MRERRRDKSLSAKKHSGIKMRGSLIPYVTGITGRQRDGFLHAALARDQQVYNLNIGNREDIYE